jgi:carbonic anhydrase
MNKPIDLLIAGYQKFYEQYYQQKNNLFDTLTRYGQKPEVLIIACSDSRVDPAIVTNAQPGDLFVVRNVANLVPLFEKNMYNEEDTNSYHGISAALEFGICMLDVKHIIVFGHSQCGGISSLFQKTEAQKSNKNFIGKWMELAQGAHDHTIKHHANTSLEEQITWCSHYSLINSLENLKSFPWINEKIKSNSLSLHAWYFDLINGRIDSFDQQKKSFITLSTA